MVAKSYIGLEQLGDPYSKNGKQYVKVKTKSGSEKEVRWYTEIEFAKLYPDLAGVDEGGFKRTKSLKDTLGFTNGYITIFKGNTYDVLDWFKASVARYHCYFGWYIISTDEVPTDLPSGIEPVKLNWEDISENENKLKAETAIKAVIGSLIYEESPSEYQGNIGERLEVEAKVVRADKIENQYGVSTIHSFEDADQNVYIWITAAKSLPVGLECRLKGTVKDHKNYRNTKQTILTRCQIN